MGGIPILDLAFEDVADVAARRPRGPDTPERKLARAIATDVLIDLHSEMTRQWIEDDVDEYPGHVALPLNWVADKLGVPAEALRERLRALAHDPKVRFRQRQRGIEMVRVLEVELTVSREGGEDVATG